MSQPKIFYPYMVDQLGSIQTIHRKLASHLNHKYSFGGFVHERLEEVSNIFDKCVYVKNKSRPMKAILYSKEYVKSNALIHTGQPRHFMRSYRLARAASLRGASIVHTLHTRFDVSTPRGRYQKRAVQHADVVTGVYPYMVEWARESLGADDVRLVTNGVDLSQFSPEHKDTDPEQILYVGRFKNIRNFKNPQFLLELAAKLPELQFEMVGGDRNDLPSNIEVSQNVTLHGYLSKSELAKLYAQSAVLVCPFKIGGAGMVAMEAAASGTPVIALNTGATPFTVPDTCGIRLETLEHSAWTSAIDSIRTENHQFESRAAVRQYSWEAISEKYDNIYSELLN